MDYFEAVKTRRSTRAFQRKPVEEEKIRRIIEVINLAPSAGDLQAYEVIVVKDPMLRDKLAKAAGGQGFVSEAPICFVFVAYPQRSSKKYGRKGSELYCVQDATIAATYAMLTATVLGLSSTWVGAFDEEAAARTVGATEGKRPIAILPVGYAAESPEITPRRPISEIAFLDTSGVPYPFSFTDKSFERPTWNLKP
ncbi:MAG TPA: nitroreductase family protein [Candidatus Acidoferrum sp.]|nr:nitroreductase family protein [Candidatus Acidoferrum sp.]